MPRLHLWVVVTKPPDVQIWKRQHWAELYSLTTDLLSSISVKMNSMESMLAHLSSTSLSVTPLFLTSFKCWLLTLWLGIPLDNWGAFPPSVTSQPSLKHLVHHSYTYHAKWTGNMNFIQRPQCFYVSPWLHGSLGSPQAPEALVSPTVK